MKITESQLRLIVRNEIMKSEKVNQTLSEGAAPDFSKYGLSPAQGDHLWLAFHYMVKDGHVQTHDLKNPTALFNETLGLYKELSAYGELSGRKSEELLAGARIEVAGGKKNPGDFVLWKGNVVGSLWDSPWGQGRPGWHIECSTFVQKYAGDTVTIHGGGIDLLFPHHENECAQSRSLTGKPLAQYWLHNAHVTLNAEKMSKSLGNVFSIRDVLAEFDPMVVRFYLIQHHYRTPLDINKEHIASAARAYNKLVRAFNRQAIAPDLKECVELPSLWRKRTEEYVDIAAVDAAFADDVNMPKALGVIFANLDRLAAEKETAELMRIILQQTFGLDLMPVAEEVVLMTAQIEQLIAEREKARANKQWARADQLRSELAQLGYQVVDKK